MNTSVKLHALRATDYGAYLKALLFVAGNILLPQLCHLIPQGGMMFLPIYFFTLIAAYKYGLVTGLCTALLSPVLNHLWFGMPMAEMLPVILSKSVLLALAAAYAAKRTQSVSLISLAAVVCSYQLVGMGIEFALTGSWAMAFQDIRIGFPGILLQVFGGYGVLRLLARY